MDKTPIITTQTIEHEITSCMDEFIEDIGDLFADTNRNPFPECDKCHHYDAPHFDTELGFVCEKCKDFFCIDNQNEGGTFTDLQYEFADSNQY